MNRRLFRLAETSLATLRKRAFRHIHDLSLLTQGTAQRGALVSPAGPLPVAAQGVGPPTRRTQTARVRDVRDAQFSVLKPQSASFFLSETADGLATAVVVVVGILLGTGALGIDLPGADLTAG